MSSEGRVLPASAVPAPARTGRRGREEAQRATYPHAPSPPCRPRTFENVSDGSNAPCQRPDEPKMSSIDSFNPGPPPAGLGPAATLTSAWHLRTGPLTLLSSALSRSRGRHGQGPESGRKAMAGGRVVARPLPRPRPGGQGLLLRAEESGHKWCSRALRLPLR